MPKTAVLIFPHQLFSDHPGLKKYPDSEICLIEDYLFFGDHQYPLNFHRQKLVLHRASLKSFEAKLKSEERDVNYFEYKNQQSDLERIFEYLNKKSIQKLVCVKVVDYILEKRLNSLAQKYKLVIEWLETPSFLNTPEENQNYRAGKKRWFMADFYQFQRKRLNCLLDEDGKPQGGKWSFDEENRKKLPKKEIHLLPKLSFPEENEFVKEAKNYVSENFPKALGSMDRFLYPIDDQQAQAWLDDFLKTRFKNFGPYEDAIVEDESWLFHSILTPMLNTGLLTPTQVIEKTLDFAKNNEVSLASLEGFIRQIIGWREFMRASYEDLGVKMRTTNHWQHTRKIPASFYTGTTGIIPIDNTIKRVLETGYCHHIERLMVLGGFMFLCEFDPDEIYAWFMELFIDSYDWVMVPNVYAMSQNADGGLITTKPYFSGSNYICKMSHYQKGEWAGTWDGLYWRWILKHADDLRKNPRWAMMVRMAEKMDPVKKENHQKVADRFLAHLD